MNHHKNFIKFLKAFYFTCYYSGICLCRWNPKSKIFYPGSRSHRIWSIMLHFFSILGGFYSLHYLLTEIFSQFRSTSKVDMVLDTAQVFQFYCVIGITYIISVTKSQKILRILNFVTSL